MKLAFLNLKFSSLGLSNIETNDVIYPCLESPPKFWDKISGWDFQRCKVEHFSRSEKAEKSELRRLKPVRAIKKKY